MKSIVDVLRFYTDRSYLRADVNLVQGCAADTDEYPPIIVKALKETDYYEVCVDDKELNIVCDLSRGVVVGFRVEYLDEGYSIITGAVTTPDVLNLEFEIGKA